MDISTADIQGQFTCHCCRKGAMTLKALGALADLVDLLPDGTVLRLHSAYRCKQHNAEVGGSPYSRHMRGEALDLSCDGIPARELYRVALQVERYRDGGIGLYEHADGRPGFVHLDVRDDGPARWYMLDGKLAKWPAGVEH